MNAPSKPKSRTALKPSVKVFADYEVIQPPSDLRRYAVRVKGEKEMTLEDEAIAKAEAALAELSSDFVKWMGMECQRLDEARRVFLVRPDYDPARQALFRVAHDIKGEADTFGYPLASPLADSLTKLLLSPLPADEPFRELVSRHVDALRALVREEVRAGDHPLAIELGRALSAQAAAMIGPEEVDAPALQPNA
jgi:chemotaxis protein histidine kinase CheA